jgi:hypothetical protein
MNFHHHIPHMEKSTAATLLFSLLCISMFILYLGEIWESIDEIEGNSVILNLFRFRAIVLQRRGLYTEAIGDIHFKHMEWEKALSYYHLGKSNSHCNNQYFYFLGELRFVP